ncbi:Beta-catenin-like protein 1, partial [Leucoagaricus sp. SymC.cos]
APKLPVGSLKRKMPDNPTPEMLKRMKVETPLAPVTPTEKGKARAVIVEDAPEDDTDFAPGGDADYFAEEDEEGRFYGGGLTQEQKQILNIFDSATGEGPSDEVEELSVTSIRRILLKFERAVDKNADQRSKYPDDPTKFIDSEADLDLAIKSLLPLAQVPSMAYPELVKSGAVNLLIGLLTHENMDIVIDVVEVIHELTDEDVGADEEQEESEESEESEEPLKLLVDNLVENSILDLLTDNLKRVNEAEESDRQGLFHILGIFENILGLNPELSTTLASKPRLLPWLLERIQAKAHNENRSYAAELLSILLQNNPENRVQFGQKDGVESVLKVLSQFRRRDPVDADETEFMENLFDALCSALSEAPVKRLFLESEGPDLMVLMMKEKKQSRSRSIKTLDYAMSGSHSSIVCAAFVEALGLKTLFSAFMGKAQKKKNASVPPSEDLSHILGIISSLLTNLPSDTPERIRLLAKFVENNYEKVDKLLDIRDSARTRLKATDKEIEAVRKEMVTNSEGITDQDQDLWYLRRLDSGLFTLQTVDYILGWIIMEDDGIRVHALHMLNRKDQNLKNIVETLRIYHENVGEPDAQGSDKPTQKQILSSLIGALDS